MLLPSVYSIRKNEAPQCPQYSIVLRGNGEGYIQKIKRLGLNITSGDKFIPSEYKLGSREQRLALLRGLMDTDGHANRIESVSQHQAEYLRSFCSSCSFLGGNR